MGEAATILVPFAPRRARAGTHSTDWPHRRTQTTQSTQSVRASVRVCVVAQVAEAQSCELAKQVAGLEEEVAARGGECDALRTKIQEAEVRVRIDALGEKCSSLSDEVGECAAAVMLVRMWTMSVYFPFYMCFCVSMNAFLACVRVRVCRGSVC